MFLHEEMILEQKKETFFFFKSRTSVQQIELTQILKNEKTQNVQLYTLPWIRFTIRKQEEEEEKEKTKKNKLRPNNIIHGSKHQILSFTCT